MKFFAMYNWKTETTSGNTTYRFETEKLDLNKVKEELKQKYGYTDVIITKFTRLDEEFTGTKADIEIEREKKEAAKNPPAPVAPSDTPVKKTWSRKKKVVSVSE